MGLIVTTKKGGRGKARFNSTQMTMSTVSNYIDVLSADQLRDVVNAMRCNGNNTYRIY
jgi:hypothetical protein